MNPISRWTAEEGSVRRPTLREVAASAGVSVSTVSRVLDERLPPSKSAAAARVRKVAEELGHRRNLSAASLRRGETGTIGVIVPRLSDAVMAILYESIAAVCRQSRRFAIVGTTGDVSGADRLAAETLIGRGVDGLIISTVRSDDDFPTELRERGVPHVFALRTDGVSPSSVSDDALGGYLATRHLLDLGHERIALIAGPDYASSARGRQDGYRKAMGEAGLQVEASLIAGSGFSIEEGYEAASELMGAAHRPTAIFAVNDNAAIGALSAVHALGLGVPTDVSIVGYNDTPIISRLPTPLTSVRVPFGQIAQSAVDLLVDPPGVDEDVIRVATPTLIPRRSTARYAGSSGWWDGGG